MKKILSIDGGGIRGIIPAIVLKKIEEETNQATAKTFDLIAGTSTGGLLALGLSKGGGEGKKERYTAGDLVDICKNCGSDIFGRDRRRDSTVETLISLKRKVSRLRDSNMRGTLLFGCASISS